MPANPASADGAWSSRARKRDTSPPPQGASGARTPLDVTAAVAAVDRYFEDHLDELITLAGRVTFGPVYGRGGYFSPDEYVSFAYIRIVAHLEASRDAVELGRRLEVALQPGYLFATMRNGALDLSRALRDEQPTWDGEPGSAEPGDPAPDLRRDVATLALITRVLRERALRPDRPRTALSDRHVECWLALVKDSRGSLTELANCLGLDRSRVTQLLNEARSKVLETVYLAGVLALPGSLRSAAVIERCLDAYDDRSRRTALPRNLRAHLETAANAIRLTVHAGQRADHRRAGTLHLKRRDQRALAAGIGRGEVDLETYLDEFAATLHAAETRHADTIANPHPNCTLNCDAHNPVHDRVVWEVDLP